MSSDVEMEQYGPSSIYLRKPEKERIEAQNTPFDAKSAYFVTDTDEMYVKGKLTKREGGKATVDTVTGKVSMKMPKMKLEKQITVLKNKEKISFFSFSFSKQDFNFIKLLFTMYYVLLCLLLYDLS